MNSTQRLDQLKQELTDAMTDELAITAEVAAAQQRLRVARKEVAHRAKQVRAQEAVVTYEASIRPADVQRFF